MTTIFRSDIEKALNELISNEVGMGFQGLAVVLAKKRWPELIACERKKDLGVDAIARASLAPDGVGKALACSITAVLKKIRDDATKIQTNFDNIQVLVFATPGTVTNQTAKKWAAEIQKNFGYELVVMEREEFITSLMDPVNAPLCRSHLGIPVTVEDDVVELFQRAQQAASEAIAAWSGRLEDRPLIELRGVKIGQDGRDTAEVLHLGDIGTALAQSRRMVVEAPAGRGKTTTLVQLAGKPDTGGLAFLIDLPAWIKSRTGILQFIAGMPSFQSRSLGAEALARLYKAEHFSFFLNGWNEIAESDSIQAVEALAELERNFPAAGIVVATRTHHIIPPLPGAWRVRLLPLTRTQRTQYLKQRLGRRADELCSTLDSDSVLDDLTRTPFILSEVTVIFEAGAPIPATKLGVLRGVVRVLEQSPEHRNHLQLTPLSGRADEYLSALAIEMTEQGGVTTPEDHARSVVSSVASKLRDALQISTPPEPSAVLGALCAHHILERVEYPIVSFRFEHQQFQEFYVAERLKDQLSGLIGKQSTDEFREFTKRYVNEPAWSEPLRMIAQEIGAAGTPSSDDWAIKSGSLLVKMALGADPVYAAELSRLCGAPVWRGVGSALSARLRSLHQGGDANYREYALAGMIATGSEDFSDIILPRVTSDDQEVRLSTYRTWGDFHVSSLGPDWQKVVTEWQEEARFDFVSELIHTGNLPPNLLSFLLADNSSKVKEAAISALVWIGSSEDAAKLLGTLDDETFETALRHFSTEEMPESIRPRAMAVYQKLASESAGTLTRIRTLVRRAELGHSDIVTDLKAELSKCDTDQIKQLGDFVLKPALEVVQKEDAEWVSHWVANRIIDGAMWPDHWITLVTSIPQDLKESLLSRIENEDFKHVRHSGIVVVLAACSDAVLAERVFAKLCKLSETIASGPDERHETEHAIKSQLENLFRAIPVKLAVSSLSSRLSGQVNAIELTVAAHLFGRRGREDPDLRGELDTNLRQALRAYLKKGLPVMLREEDFSGVHKADLASALAQVGEREDMAALRELIRSDIERVRKGRAAKARGEMSRLANGGVMSYSNWHVRAVVQLDYDAADTLLLEVLNEPEYERDAALALVDLAPTPVSPKVGADLFGNKRNYRDVWQARTTQVPSGFNEERRKRYAAAIRGRVAEVLEEYAARGQAASYDFRLGELTKALASIDSHGSADLIWRALSFSGRRDDWRTVETLEILLFNGIGLPTEESLKIFDAILQQVRLRLYDNQEAGLLAHALCLLPFVDNPSAGIAKMRQVISELRFPLYELRDVAMALGHSRCPEALQALRDLVPDKIHAEQLGDAWINAVAELDSPESRQLLLSFLDPDISGLSAEATFDREDVLAARVAELARRDTTIEERILRLCDMQLPTPKRSLLSRVVAWLGTPEAILAALNLIDDGATPAVPREIWNLIETAFLERKPHGKDSNAYTLAPRSSNSIRARLFEMVTQDERRKKSAVALLGQIEVWRIEHGRPNGEPRNPALDSSDSWPPVVRAS